MKKVLVLASIFFLLSSCSIDWNDKKDKKIEQLEKQIKSYNLESQKLEFEKQKYEEEKKEVYRKECLEKKENDIKELEDFTNTCVNEWWNTIDFCLNSPAGKIFKEVLNDNYITNCINKKQSLSY